MGFILYADKKGEKRAYCVSHEWYKSNDNTRVYLEWKSLDSPGFPCIPTQFSSEKQAWYYFVNAKKTAPEAYEGWRATVKEVER